MQPWIPLRVCQALPPRQKILLLLRDPVSRAFSGYHQCISVGQFWPPRLRATANRTDRELDHFSLSVALEVDVAQRCSPWGTGDPERDAALGEAYAECCAQVAARYGLQSPHTWPLCTTTPRCRNGTRVGPHRRMAISLGGTFGQWCYTHVLAGVYARHLRLWYRHHRPSDVLLARSEAFFANESAFMHELTHQLLGHNRTVRPVVSVRAAVATGSAKMSNTTRRLLQQFYQPFNEELEELLGVSMGWDYGEAAVAVHRHTRVPRRVGHHESR
mmetsp:Transcript_9218/g.29221  ORF Transcript_9218/g.29221 Transcript_9218/m.29221 type:complete len:273 (+) Transcript_9218:530-1348(+)